ncbi:MAG TPA: dTMP kinase [Thermoplasmata archaeon]|nr:dTMP kinase [Thermoplasmata archaeon]
MLKGFVTFEGIDGSGKSTVSRLVAESLEKRGERVFLTGEPTHSWLGDAIRRAYHDDVGPLAESFLFLADRAAHLEEIRAHLVRGELVLCDRYADSTYAYQAARLEGVVDKPMAFLQGISEPWVVPPDLTILLRISAEAGLARIADRPAKVRFEDLSLLTKVAANYDLLARSKRYAVVDATRTKEDIVDEVIRTIETRLAGPRPGAVRSRRTRSADG